MYNFLPYLLIISMTGRKLVRSMQFLYWKCVGDVEEIVPHRSLWRSSDSSNTHKDREMPIAMCYKMQSWDVHNIGFEVIFSLPKTMNIITNRICINWLYLLSNVAKLMLICSTKMRIQSIFRVKCATYHLKYLWISNKIIENDLNIRLQFQTLCCIFI